MEGLRNFVGGGFEHPNPSVRHWCRETAIGLHRLHTKPEALHLYHYICVTAFGLFICSVASSCPPKFAETSQHSSTQHVGTERYPEMSAYFCQSTQRVTSQRAAVQPARCQQNFSQFLVISRTFMY